jgi:hypothetical protein
MIGLFNAVFVLDVRLNNRVSWPIICVNEQNLGSSAF